MLLREAIQSVRSMLTGSMLGDITVLDTPYDPITDDRITLRYGRPALAQGAILSVGLNTFVALEVANNGTEVVVLPSADGGPNVAAPAGEIVYVQPHFTTASVYREIVSEIQGLSSPLNGLYAIAMFQSDGVSYSDGVYYVDPDNLAAGREILRMVKAEYRIANTEAWQTFTDAEWQPSASVVRVFADPPQATEYLFTFATTFGTPTLLDDDLLDFGVTDVIAECAQLGAAAAMALGWEGRRTQPLSQGDSRRAQEVNVTGNTSLARMFESKKQARVNEEAARLLSQYGIRQNIVSGGTTWGAVNR